MTQPLFGPYRYQYKGDRAYVYSKVFAARTIRFNLIIRTLLFIISPLTWYCKSSILVVRAIKRNGLIVKKIAGISIFRQLTAILSLAFLKNTPPYYYYYLKLYQNSFSIGDDFLVNRHFAHLYSGLLCSKESSNLLSNKIDFYNRLSHSIREIPKIELVTSKSDISSLFNLNLKCNSDLFIKPMGGSAGRDCFLFGSSNGYFSLSSASINLNDKRSIEFFLKEICKKEIYIAQLRLTNHNQIVHITNGNLASCRINTCINKAGEISIHFAIFKMPVGKSIISNLSGSIITPVNIDSGKLGMAISIRKPFDPIEYHPDGKGRINGTVLPYWQNAVDICIKAHQFFLDTSFIGWDIAFTPNGVRLLEGNSGWGVEEWQLSHKERFNPDDFISLLSWHLRKHFKESKRKNN